MLVELRQLGAGRVRRTVVFFPLITLAIGAVATLIISVASSGSLTVLPFDLWYGSFALALWPLFMALVAWRWRGAAPAKAPSSG